MADVDENVADDFVENEAVHELRRKDNIVTL